MVPRLHSKHRVYQVRIKQSNLMPLDWEPNPRHEYLHQLSESIPPHGVNVFLLSNPSLPSCGWLLAGLHLLTHPLHHALHPNRWLHAVLIIFQLLWPFKVLEFGFGFATMIGRYKSLLRPLMLRCLVPWCLIPWSMIRSLIPWSLMLGQRSCVIICLSGHFFLDLCFLCFKKGALGSDMPT
jgi:hypothetical protein